MAGEQLLLERREEALGDGVVVGLRSRIEKKISTLLSQLACTGRWTRLLTPNDYADLAVLARTLNRFEQHWYAVAAPVAWNFTGVTSLAALMERLRAGEPQLRLAV